MEPLQYLKKTMDDAEFILGKLLSFAPESFMELKNINILVIGAGSFPSFIPLIRTLTHACPEAQSLNLTLLEPNQSATDLFKSKVSKMTGSEFNVVVHFSIHNSDIKSYLNTPSDAIFDLIYFEHPDFSFLSVLLTKAKLAGDKLAISMQESIPHLRNIIKEQSLIIATCIFNDDLRQIKSLLEFSLGIKMRLVRQPRMIFDGRYYSFGLAGAVHKAQMQNKAPNRLVEEIGFTTILFGVFLLASVIIFLITPNKLKVVSFFFLIAQLFYTRYGVGGLIVRLFLIIGQAIILAIGLHE
jgi:hypothetical protein